MTLPRPLFVALYLAGRPWTVWVVAIGLVIAMRAEGAGGFDAVILAIGPTLLWMGFSWICRALTRHLGNPFERSILPTDKPLPKPQLAVMVVLDHEAGACPEPSRMVEQLPQNLRQMISYNDKKGGA